MKIELRWKRILLLGATGILSTLIMLAMGSAWMYASAILRPGCQGDRASLEMAGFASEPVEFASRDGPVLRGWYTAGDSCPETAIIVIPGHAGNSAFAVPEASTLAKAGFSTLIFEHRSCADPSLTASTGYYEAYDLLGAVDYLKNRPEVKHIGALGFSEGGTATILAAAEEPALEAIVAMGGYTSLENDILDPDSNLGPLDQIVRRLILVSTSLQLGIPAQASSPIRVIDQIAPRPILLIYGEYEDEPGQALYQAAGDPKELWIVPGAGHGRYQQAAPEEYERRIVAFFEKAFQCGDCG